MTLFNYTCPGEMATRQICSVPGDKAATDDPDHAECLGLFFYMQGQLLEQLSVASVSRPTYVCLLAVLL